MKKTTIETGPMPEWRDGQPACMGHTKKLYAHATLEIDDPVYQIGFLYYCLDCGAKREAKLLKRRKGGGE
jgi:hypothetical protein